jgi:hypothetical protein
MSLLDDIKDLPVKRWGSLLLPGYAKHLQIISPRTRQFIFDEEASRKLGVFIRDCPDILIDQLEFARPPYDPFYAEIDIFAAHQALGKPTTQQLEKYRDTPSDWRIGFIYDHGGIVSLVNEVNKPEAKAMPFGIADLIHRERGMGTPFRLNEEGKDIYHQQVLLGTTWDDITPAQREAFATRFSLNYYGHSASLEDWIKKFDFHNLMGEARTYAATVLLLYQQRHITIGSRPYERKIVRGKLRTFMAHHTVTIHLEATEMRKALGLGHHASPRRHEVRTHYAHRYGTRGACEHNWIRIENAANEQWRCAHCNRLRWLRKTHLRGDAAKGFVTKHYEVQL